ALVRERVEKGGVRLRRPLPPTLLAESRKRKPGCDKRSHHSDEDSGA
ncbi:MAG: hypothetical protein K0S65_4751, partial [Labilithrix sp.]|nr:hypothetical protein [Labilithrix sp.]